MSLRSIVLTCALLLLVVPLVSAGEASVATDSASVSMAAIFSTPASSDCANATLPSGELSPIEQAGVICGACSDPICQGKQFGQYCGFDNGQFYSCRPAYYVCTPKDCQCWTGPLP